MNVRKQNSGGLPTAKSPQSRLSPELLQRLNNFCAFSRRGIETANAPKKKTPNQLPKLAFNLRETAWMMSLSTRTVRRLVKRRLLLPSKASRRWIFSRASIEKLLEETTID
jgi:hypothetical protein